MTEKKGFYRLLRQSFQVFKRSSIVHGIVTLGLAALLMALLVELTGGLAAAQRLDRDGHVGPSGNTNPVTVLYQGHVTVGYEPYNSTGFFKFAIVNTEGNTTYWSNDGTSTGGGEPIACVSLQVRNGYFTVLLGDTSLAGMSQVLTPSVFAGPGRYLRVWFATSTSGPYAQLSLVPIAAVPYALNAETVDGYDSSALQQRVSGTCAAGSAIRVVNSDGTVTCETDDNTTYSAGDGLDLVGTTFSVDVTDIIGTGLTESNNNIIVSFAGSGSASTVSRSDHNHWGASWSGSGQGLALGSTNATALYGTRSTVSIWPGASGGQAIWGDSSASVGVYATSDSNIGAYGRSDTNHGVYGETNSTYYLKAGVYGHSFNQAAGVIGYGETGTGVRGIANIGVAIYGHSNDTDNRASGVKGYSQYGYGVHGAPWDGYAAVFGEAYNGRGGLFRSYYGGPGVYAESTWGYGAYISHSLYVVGNIYATGSKSGFVVDIALNADEVALQQGDVVAVVGVSDPILGQIPVMEVRRATSANPTAVVGVVDQVFVHNGEPNIILSDCVQQREMIERMQPEIPQPNSGETDGPLMYLPSTPPLPDNCFVPEGLFPADSIRPGDYLSIVTLGAYGVIKVDASYGVIRTGDLLVASPNPGYAMRATNPQAGTIVGKALADWESGTGVIPVLVTLD